MRKYSTVRQRERVRRNDAIALAGHVDELSRRNLRVDDGGVDVGEQLELVGAADVIAIAGRAVGNDALAVAFLDLAPSTARSCLSLRHAAYPFVAFNRHRRGIFREYRNGGRRAWRRRGPMAGFYAKNRHLWPLPRENHC
jgi:hypothetical protein